MSNGSLTALLQRKQAKVRLAGFVLLAAMVLFTLAAIGFGRADISMADAAAVIYGQLTGSPEAYAHINAAKMAIIWDIRLPRILAAIAVGGGLAVAGVVFQALLMNPLADSYTMGVSTGAAFGASVAIYLNIFTQGGLPVTLFAFGGAVATLLIVMSMARVGGYVSSANLVIAGIIVSSINRYLLLSPGLLAVWPRKAGNMCCMAGR
ncbi:MAG: putative transporter permease protein [Firmicutes bacterium]|nr:putative transporter permease protein [Bacillota bacterium]